MTPELIDTARSLQQAGINVVPVNLSTKAPLVKSWQHLQTSGQTPMELEGMLKHGGSLNGQAGLAMVTGKYGENTEALICLDIDNKCGNAKALTKALFTIPEVTALFEGKAAPYVQNTQSGGVHVWFRSVGGHNTKLAAEYDAEGKAQTTFETREDGGYAILYKAVKGDLLNLPVLTAEEKELLYSYARSFNKVFKEVKPVKGTTATGPVSGARPGDAFNSDPKAADFVRELLERDGWRHTGNNNHGELWRRPGKNHGISATFNGDVFYVFSSNAAPFEPERGYSKFQAFALLAYKGDWGAAAKGLASKGYGEQSVSGLKPSVASAGELIVTQSEEQQTFFIQTVITPRGGISYKIDYNLYHRFLEEQNFRKFIQGDDFILVRMEGKLVDQVQIFEIANFCRQYIEKTFDPAAPLIDYLIAQEKKLFDKSKLSFLPTLPDDFNLDSETEGWLYFKNTAVKVERDREGFTFVPYHELPKPVWRDEVIPRDFDKAMISDETPGEFERFCRNICNQDEERLHRLMSAIGYIIHTAKSQASSRAVIFSDEKIPENEDDANGGTGKSLLGKFVAQYRKTVFNNGKQLAKGDTRFAYQDVSHDTRVIMFDDISKSFPFDFIFAEITGDIKVERKNLRPFVIPYRHAPKFLITTNYAVKGTGTSYDRRKYEVELFPYYDEKRRPIDEFGHEFFHGWEKTEQSRADLFALDCLAVYLDNGLVDVENKESNSKTRQLLAETGRDFVEFIMQQFYTRSIVEFIEFDRKALFEKFNEENPGYEKMKFSTFTKYFNKLAYLYRIPCQHRHSGAKKMTLLGGRLQKLAGRYYKASGTPLPEEGGEKCPI